MSEFKQQLWSMDMLPKDILINKIKKLEQALEEIKSLCYEQDLNEDFFACEVLQKICEVMDD